MTSVAATLWAPLGANRVRCDLCAHCCELDPGQRGPCHLRHNDQGKLRTEAFRELRVALASPVERKPLFHFMPGTRTWTVGTAGCSLRCRYCQNAPLSQPVSLDACELPRLPRADPAQVVEDAQAAGAGILAFAYSEPTIAYEWVRDTMAAARGAGLPTAWVTNGFLSRGLIARLADDGPPDAVNVDIKAAQADAWQWLSGGAPGPVLEAMAAFRELGCWVEATTVLVPGFNDRPSDVDRMATWILERLGSHTPWHLWRFHPDGRLRDRGPTATRTLVDAAARARAAGLVHVYLGPAASVPPQATICPTCQRAVIAREGYEVVANDLASGRCPGCRTPVSGIWSPRFAA